MTDLGVDPERAEWLRALRSTNDAYVLRLLDEHTQRVQAEAWLRGAFAVADQFNFVAELPPNPYETEDDHEPF